MSKSCMFVREFSLPRVICFALGRLSSRRMLTAMMVVATAFASPSDVFSQVKPARHGEAVSKTPSPAAKFQSANKENKKSGSDQFAEAEKPKPKQIIPADGNALYKRLLQSAVWIYIDTGPTSYSWGSGWLADEKERLVITNHHVVNDRAKGTTHAIQADARITVHVPTYDQGQLLVDKSHYISKVAGVPARVIDTDSTLDLAVLQLDKLPAGLLALPLATQSPSPGDRIHSLGNPSASDALWVYTSGAVRQVYRTTLQYPPDQNCEFLRVETQSPTNPGDSGGPVINERGELIAVTSGELTGSRLMTIQIDVSEVRSFLQQARQLINAKTAQEMNDRGVHYYERQRYQKAIEDFTKAHELDPTLSDAFGNRGWSFLALDDAETAKTDFDAAIALNADDPNYYEGRAAAFTTLREHALAIQDYTSAIRYDANNAALYSARGDVKFADDDFEDAIRDYSHAIRVDPSEPDYYNSRGASYASIGQHNSAISDYSKAIELNDRDPVYYHNRAIAYHEDGQDEQAGLDFYRLEVVDAEYAKQQKNLYRQRYLRLENQTDERIHVWLKYHTLEDDQWVWKPAPPDEDGWVTVAIEPGESTFIQHRGSQVSADRIRIWGANGKTAKDWGTATALWNRYENEDLRLIDAEGEQWYFMRNFVLPFK